MATRREIVEGILFLPAMLILAGVVFLLGWAIIVAGGWIVNAWFALFHGIGLPKSAALALAVLATAVTVPTAIGWLLGYRRKRKATP